MSGQWQARDEGGPRYGWVGAGSGVKTLNRVGVSGIREGRRGGSVRWMGVGQGLGLHGGGWGRGKGPGVWGGPGSGVRWRGGGLYSSISILNIKLNIIITPSSLINTGQPSLYHMCMHNCTRCPSLPPLNPCKPSFACTAQVPPPPPTSALFPSPNKPLLLSLNMKP